MRQIRDAVEKLVVRGPPAQKLASSLPDVHLWLHFSFDLEHIAVGLFFAINL